MCALAVATDRQTSHSSEKAFSHKIKAVGLIWLQHASPGPSHSFSTTPELLRPKLCIRLSEEVLVGKVDSWRYLADG